MILNFNLRLFVFFADNTAHPIFLPDRGFV